MRMRPANHDQDCHGLAREPLTPLALIAIELAALDTQGPVPADRPEDRR